MNMFKLFLKMDDCIVNTESCLREWSYASVTLSFLTRSLINFLLCCVVDTWMV